MEFILLSDPDKCTGCRICESGCSLIKEKMANPLFSRVKVVKFEEKGIDFPVLCFHCEEPPCMNVCPVGAVKREGKAVVINDERCIGCKLCVIACPFGSISVRGNRPIKCDLCGGDPFCATICPTHAIFFDEEFKSGSEKRIELVKRFLSGERVV